MSTGDVKPEDAWQVANIVPSELYYTDFRRVLLGGYDRDEVNAFREHVSEMFESLLTQIRELKAQNEKLEKDLVSYNEMEEALRNALKSSQKFSETILDTARREADALLAEASLAYARTQSQLKEMPENLRAEIRELQDARDRCRQDMLSMLNAHRTLLGEIPPAEARGEGEPPQSKAHRAVSARLRSFNFGPRAKPEVVPMTAEEEMVLRESAVVVETGVDPRPEGEQPEEDHAE